MRADMGQAKQKVLSQAALLEANPFCIYCGGRNPATTIDHLPPRIMFRGKLRPRQFEFPCCAPCNKGTKDTDQLIAWIGRTYPDPVTESDKTDVQKILRGLKNNMPDVLREMYIGTAGQKLARKRTAGRIQEPGGFLRLDGPLVSQHLDVFGCKLGLAMHWEFTKQVIPPSGGIVVRFFSNIEAIEGKIPNRLLDLLPGPQTLRQGSWDVADQFKFAARTTDDKNMGLFFASFRFSIAVVALTAMDRTLLNSKIGPVFSPGALWNGANKDLSETSKVA
jgi:hypothetical protein